MRTLFPIVVALVVVTNTFIMSRASAQTFSDTAQAQRLEVGLIAEKHIYKRGDKINLKVMVINTTEQDMFVYGNLEWGYLASLTLCLRDAKGSSIQPKFIADAVTYPPDDKSQFVRLLPYHFLGTYFISSIEDLNIQRRGRYAIFIEYRSPIDSSKAGVSPFYGKENGVIRSNTIWIEVQ
jgi:hypothetical protein